MLPYYKQQTPFTCSLACLRMVLESIGRKFTEYELSKIVRFNYRKGFSPKMIEYLCQIINVEYEYHFNSSIEELIDTIKSDLYSMVLVNPSILYDLPEEEHGHYVIIKNISEEKVIINDPDQEYGSESKEVDKEKFLESWENKHKFVFIIKGGRG